MDIAENFGSSANQDAIGNLRMPVAVFLPRAAERDRLQNRHPISDDCGLTHHQPAGVVEHDSVPEACRRMDVDAKLSRHLTLQKEREGLTVVFPQPMANAMNL